MESSSLQVQSGRQHQEVLPSAVLGTVTCVGYYRDTMPQLIITVKKQEARAIPFREGERVPVPFIIKGDRFVAGIRTTIRSATVMICPDLSSGEEATVRLVDLLAAQGWNSKKSRLVLTVVGGAIVCEETIAVVSSDSCARRSSPRQRSTPAALRKEQELTKSSC